MSSPTYDPARAAFELNWLIDHPEFIERPATIEEFLGPGYLETGNKIRPGIRDALIEIFGDEVQTSCIAKVQRAMVTGAIGIGKTTFASIALPYMVHWVLCLRDPQDYFNLLPGSRIAFMQMSTSESQAREVIFGDVFARINHSPWFIQNAPHDDKFTKQIRFPGKDIWILPGDSAETTFEGYNILAGIIDEMDSHKVTKDKDYADSGYNTIHARITSRFGDRGLVICIGQMKKAVGFAQRKYQEFLNDPKGSYVCRMTLWESHGWDSIDPFTKVPRYLDPMTGERDSFFYDPKRRALLPKTIVELLNTENKEHLLEIPTAYRKDFENKPEMALRDLAGIPPSVEDPFITLVDKIELCRDRWIERHGIQSPVNTNPSRVEFEKWFVGLESRKRVLHIDNAYSANGDALGMAMGHVEAMVEKDGERKPYIVIDFIARVKAGPGTEIMFSDIRKIVYMLRDEMNFKLKKVSMDGFQSTDTMQQLRKKRYEVEPLSVDKSTLPYEDLREAIYEERIEFPPYVTYLSKGDPHTTEILVKELMELHSDGLKIDHPPTGSKDVADAVAGVVYTLMGDRTYRRGFPTLDNGRDSGNTATIHRRTEGPVKMDLGSLLQSGGGLSAPIPPSVGFGSTGISVPDHLRTQ